MEKETIGIVGKDLFIERIRIDPELSDILYEQLIFVLKHIGEENPGAILYHKGITFGVYLESKNEGLRKFEVEKEKAWLFWDLFGHKFREKINKFGMKQQKLGTNVLFQLNEGSLTLKDFERRFSDNF